MFVDTGTMRTMGMAMGGIMVLNVHMVVLSHRVSVASQALGKLTTEVQRGELAYHTTTCNKHYNHTGKARIQLEPNISLRVPRS
jgi:hypothetical protein